MDPKLKERLQKDFWGNKGVDLSSLMGSEKPEPTLAEHRAMMESGEKEDDKESPVDMAFDMIEESISKMSEGDILKLIHKIAMKTVGEESDMNSEDMPMPPMDNMPMLPETNAVPSPIA